MRRIAEAGKGQIAIISTLAIVTWLSVAALSVDVAVFYFNRIELQKAADTSVLAGAVYLPFNPRLAVSAADQYAEVNGVRQGEIVLAQVSPNKMSIQIRLARIVPYRFAHVLGLAAGRVEVQATAQIQTSSFAVGLAPIEIRHDSDSRPLDKDVARADRGAVAVGPGGRLVANNSPNLGRLQFDIFRRNKIELTYEKAQF
jgi:Putative Flp pilus-assembly TadE/G-like